MSLEFESDANFEVQPETSATISESALAEQMAKVVDDKAFRSQNARCVGLDPGMFFPSTGESQELPKAVCKACVVQEECLEYALVNREDFGIWGGKNERDRRRILRQRGVFDS